MGQSLSYGKYAICCSCRTLAILESEEICIGQYMDPCVTPKDLVTHFDDRCCHCYRHLVCLYIFGNIKIVFVINM